MDRQITDMETWLLDNENRIFRYLVYRRIYTPFEQERKFIDETCYESAYYLFGLIREAIDLGDGEWYIGIQGITDDELEDSLSYYYLSEIRLEYHPSDQGMLEKCE